jgi:HAD superfamily hydrolase (TIGR01509 family)
MVRAIIFDFDGLILETEGPDYHSWRELYEAHGCSLPLERWVGVIGTAEHGFDPYAELEAQLGRPLDRTAIRARRRVRYAELVAREELLPGVLEWIEEARWLGLRLGVASSSSREWVSGHLHRLDLLTNVDALACREDVVRTKPDPALYLRVLDALGVCPVEVVAVEDSPNGVAAASAAGLFCVAVPNDLTRGLPLPGADLLLGSLEDMTLREVLDRSGRNRTMGTAG